jgi:hypothetical protein
MYSHPPNGENCLRSRVWKLATINRAVLALPSGTTLILTGDDDNNAIQLLQAGGTFTVQGSNGTLINGVTEATFPSGRDPGIHEGWKRHHRDRHNCELCAFGAMTIDLRRRRMSLMTARKSTLACLSVTAGDGRDIVSIEAASTWQARPRQRRYLDWRRAL